MKAKRAKKTQRKKIDKKSLKFNLNKKQKKKILVIGILVLVVAVIYGGTIFKLQSENRELKAQKEELLSEKKALTKELKNIHSKEYIKEQARKQLRLLDKDEILFVFEDEENTGKDE